MKKRPSIHENQKKVGQGLAASGDMPLNLEADFDTKSHKSHMSQATNVLDTKRSFTSTRS